MRIKSYLTVIALLGISYVASATPVTFNFLENGLGNLGSSTNFTQNGITATAYASPGETLYAKNEGPGEVGLGTGSDSEHEINTGNFVQISLLTSPIMKIIGFTFGSIQTSTLGERVDIYYSTTLGVLGTLLGSVYGTGSGITGSFDVSSYSYTTGYYGITAGVGNIELGSMTVDVPSTVPDVASTAALLGGAMTAVGLLRRKLKA
jgi:hypothetical protein